MKQCIFKVEKQQLIAHDVFSLTLSGDCSAITAPGQFVNIKLDGFYLRRPISVCEYGEHSLRLVYKTVGAGTEKLSSLTPGAELDLLTGLGNGFNIEKSGKTPLLVGGGVGVPPLVELCKQLSALGARPTAALGFNSEKDIILTKELEEYTAEVFVSTLDGTAGQKGYVTDIIKNLSGFSYYYACGPEQMLRALYNTADFDGELSFEERMGCGFGACMGCSCKTKYGNKRICRDGPVLTKEEIIW